MNDFDYEVLQKSRLSRNARYKKNGSSSRYVSLPSDNRKAEKEDVKVYKIGKPIEYTEFKSYPHDIKVEYLKWLKDNLNATSSMIAEMWGMKPQSISTMLKRNNLTGILPKGYTAYAHKKFRKWMKNTAENENENRSVAPVVEEKKPSEEIVVEEPIFFNCISSCCMTLKGKASMVGQTLYKMFENQDIIVDVTFVGKKM